MEYPYQKSPSNLNSSRNSYLGLDLSIYVNKSLIYFVPLKVLSSEMDLAEIGLIR
jgi:hypothetical protein